MSVGRVCVCEGVRDGVLVCVGVCVSVCVCGDNDCH